MKLTSLTVGSIGTNCYILYREDTKAAVVIDPGDDATLVEARIAALSLEPRAIHGVYWGIGVGTTIARYFIMELIYSFNYGSAEFSGFAEPDFEYDISTYRLKFNVGFKFDFY